MRYILRSSHYHSYAQSPPSLSTLVAIVYNLLYYDLSIKGSSSKILAQGLFLQVTIVECLGAALHPRRRRPEDPWPLLESDGWQFDGNKLALQVREVASKHEVPGVSSYGGHACTRWLHPLHQKSFVPWQMAQLSMDLHWSIRSYSTYWMQVIFKKIDRDL